MRSLILLIVMAAFLLPGAMVFAQWTQIDEGIAVPLPDEQVLLTSSILQEQQSLSKAHSAFRTFILENREWNFRYDALRRSPHRAWGKGIPIDGFPTITLLNSPKAGMTFLNEHAASMNLTPSALRLLYSEIVDGTNYQKYIQTYKGLDVLQSHVDLRISLNGRVFMFGSDFNSSLDVDITPLISQKAAREIAKAGLAYVRSDDDVEDRGLFILPLRYPHHIDYKLVYQFEVHNGPAQHWDTYVDAHDGNIVWRRNQVCNFCDPKHGNPLGATSIVNGQVLISIFPVSWMYEPVVVPLRNAYVWIGGRMYVTDSEGHFSADLGGTSTAQLITRLSGPYAIARRADTTRVAGGSPANALQSMTVAAGQQVQIIWDDSNSIASERNTFYHMNLVRDFSRALDPGPANRKMDDQIQGLTEINNQCNAFFDGRGVNFFRSGLTCGNTGEISSVIYHEIGHGIHIWLTNNLTGRPPVNGALKEAIADLTSNMLMDDPRIGVGFLKAGGSNGIIRNSDNKRRYPEHVVNEIHDDGMILTGAVWDVRKAIGLEHTARLYHKVMYGVPDANALGDALADYFIEFLVADDDDGDLSNGTPHSEAIIAAFNAHGIPGSAIAILHDGVVDQHSVTEPAEIRGIARVSNQINQELLRITQVDVVYSIDEWKTEHRMLAQYDFASRNFVGEFPPQSAGTIVRYYIEAMDNYGGSARDPINAPTGSYLYLVGFQQQYFYDCEEADGWTVKTDATTGDWVREKPIGTWNTQLGSPPDVPWVQPDEDHTPDPTRQKCWVTGNAPRGAALGTNDVDDGATYLTTRAYDVSSMTNPVLRYYRWYTNNSGASPNDDWWQVLISSNGGSTWSVLERTKESDASWQPKVFILREHIQLTDDMKVQFIAEDLEPGSLVEAAVDDFEILDINHALVGVEEDAPIASDVQLEQNFPNPFNPATTIRFTLPVADDVELRVLNALGIEIAVLYRSRSRAGTHSVEFDAAKLPSGMYLYQLRTSSGRFTRNMMLLK